MTASLLAVVVDCRDSLSQAKYWATVLGHQVSERNTGEFEVSDSSLGGTPLYFMNVPEPKTLKNRLHIYITTDASLEDEVARLTSLGGHARPRRQRVLRAYRRLGHRHGLTVGACPAARHIPLAGPGEVTSGSGQIHFHPALGPW